MVLDDVARGTDPVVVARTTPDADVLGHRDLHVVDVVGVPDRSEHLVREAQREDVLDRLLGSGRCGTRRRAEHGRHDVAGSRAEGGRARRADHDAPPRPRRCAEPRAGQLATHDGELARRDREVERVVAARATPLVELEDRLGELVEGVVVVEGPLDEADALLEVTPRLLAERGPGVLLDGFADDLREVLGRPLTAREAREREARGAARGWTGRRPQA